MAQQTTTATGLTGTTGTSSTLSGNQETKLANAFNQQANVSGVQQQQQQGRNPYATSSSSGRLHRGRSRHPYDRESMFDTQPAFDKHQALMREIHQARQQQGAGATTGTTGTTSAVKTEAQVVLSEAEYKALKEEEKVELAKFEAVRNEVNQLIASQEWTKMEVSHVHHLGTQLRQLEHKFWNLKPIAEQLVLKGRNKLAERIDLAEEELLHAILVVSQIYRNRVMDAAHAKYPGKIHPQYLQRDHEAALRHHHAYRAHQQAQSYAYESSQQPALPYSRQQGGYYVPAHAHHQHQGRFQREREYQQPPFIGRGHPGHYGYDDSYESYGAVPYHGHPHQGYGGYY